jgi:hypothetical protein
MSGELCFIDTETTGLDARIHQPYEVCYWHENRPEPVTDWLDHDLTHADQRALEIGGYWTRGASRPYMRRTSPADLAQALEGVTLVGSNPAFDAAMLTRYIGTAVWHHRLINVSEGAMWIFGWQRPKGLSDVATECRDRGHEIPEPNHTAEGDVRTTRAVYEALVAEQGLLS